MLFSVKLGVVHEKLTLPWFHNFVWISTNLVLFTVFCLPADGNDVSVPNCCSQLPVHDISHHKVTIHPKFFRTVPNFEGLSRKKYEVIRDAELSRVPNPAPNLSWFNVKICCSSSSWWKCSCSFWHFCLSEMCFVKLKTHKILFQLGLGSLGCSPIYPIVGWQGDRDGDTPSPCISILVSSPPRKVSLDFCHRFMVTLSHHPACIITDYK